MGAGLKLGDGGGENAAGHAVPPETEAEEVVTQTMARELLRREEVEERFGVSRSWIYCEMRAGRFPEPVRIGKRAVRWRVTELDAWALGRPVAHGEIGRR